MNKEKRCINCAYWQHRKCVITGEIKNNSYCTCGQFREKEENK